MNEITKYTPEVRHSPKSNTVSNNDFNFPNHFPFFWTKKNIEPISENLDYISKEVIKILHKAASMLTSAYTGEIIYDKSKVTPIQLFTTEVDFKIEDFLKRELTVKFPQIGFIAEEEQSSKKEKKIQKKQKLYWIIDPVDGTFNFANKIPLFAISIALWEGNKPIFAAVSLPMQGDLLYAVKGKGAYLNTKLIDKNQQMNAKPYVVYAHIGSQEEQMKLYKYLLTKDAFPRFLGSGVYQTSMVCLRRVEFAVFIKTAIWDIAATILIAEEAGLHAEFISEKPNLNNLKHITDYCHSVVIGQKETVIKVAQDIKKELSI
ncbi:hypothetical protein A2476_02180 [candidate division CPR3 bacterium RIFOXYC2_FULL_35_7]|nr:MAG: hypothetical protein A2476_02180 [candidate division CPR3 bacterium RIFOXYC2_FULL_35_7]